MTMPLLSFIMLYEYYIIFASVHHLSSKMLLAPNTEYVSRETSQYYIIESLLLDRIFGRRPRFSGIFVRSRRDFFYFDQRSLIICTRQLKIFCDDISSPE